jgi:flagellar protein FliO/FliZ
MMMQKFAPQSMLACACAIAVFAAAPAWAQAVQPAAAAPSSTGSLFQVLFGLIAVLAVMAGAAWLLKRMNVARTGGAGNIRIVGGVSVGSRERVVVLEVADQWLVVGVAPGSVNALSAMPRQTTPAAAEPAPAGNFPRSFSSWLKQTMDQRNARQ